MRKRLQHAAARLERRDLDGAEQELRAILDDDPRQAVAQNLLGLVLLERRNHAGALNAFATAVELQPPFPDALVNLAVACNRSGAHELAISACEQALAARPGDANAFINLGMACKGLRRLDDAKRAFELAGAHPMARFNLGHVLMLEKDLEHGLPLLEHRRGLLGLGRDLRGPAWTGDARPDATLLVVPEQGLGDVVLMSRFFPTLADRFAKVVIVAPGPLVRLVAAIDPRLAVVTSPADHAWDLWAPVMSLPWLLGIQRLEDVPTRPWISRPGTVAGDRLRVGINWAGNPNYAYDQVRSTTLENFAPLLEVDGIEWVSLHRGPRESDARVFGLAEPLREARDFLDTADVIAGLDLVVSTETAIPNLSAAMGVPTCVACVMDVDWRWNGWYEDVTICMQREAGNWNGPVADIAGRIVAMLDAGAARAAA